MEVEQLTLNSLTVLRKGNKINTSHTLLQQLSNNSRTPNHKLRNRFVCR